MKFAAISATFFSVTVLETSCSSVLKTYSGVPPSLAGSSISKEFSRHCWNRQQECDQNFSDATHEGFQFRAVYDGSKPLITSTRRSAKQGIERRIVLGWASYDLPTVVLLFEIHGGVTHQI